MSSRRRWTNKLAESMKDFQSRDSSFEINNRASSNDLDSKTANPAAESEDNLVVDDLDSTVLLSETDSPVLSIGCDEIVVENMNSCSDNSTANQLYQSSSENMQVFLSCDSFDSNEEIIQNLNNESEKKSHYYSNSDSKIQSVNSQCDESLKNISKQDSSSQRYFSSPFNLDNSEGINQIEQPDIWDALMALEQALSPVEEHEKSIQEEPKNVLRRLSQKFKETPTKFTEKFVSIIEESCIEKESPLKENDCSGISLHRMTGEFRKLCKYIEDESMPEMAQSLINMTAFDKTETPTDLKIDQNTNSKSLKKILLSKNMNTPPHNIVNKLVQDGFVTPKNKTESKTDTPITKFTPSADKSFEFWEIFCNLECDGSFSRKKKSRRSLSVPNSTKKSMNDILIMSERQMASLNDSIYEIRNSDPCKKSNNELKVETIMRSKSETKICKEITSKEKYYNPHENEDLSTTDENSPNKFNLQENEKISNVTDNYKTKISDESCINKNRKFGAGTLSRSSTESEVFLSIENSCDNDDPDCSILIELAKRRQRCLDTAKLMMEIEREDPITSGDNKCLETLYKLGVQDETFIENEDDAKFLNTLTHCVEYKNYLSDKSKPLLNKLQDSEAANDLKNKATSIIRSSKKSITKPQPTRNLNSAKKIQKELPVLSKLPTPRHTPRNTKMLPERQDVRYLRTTQTHVKVTPRIEKRNLQPNSQIRSSCKITPKVTPRENLLTATKSVQRNNYQKKVSPTRSKFSFKTPQPEQKVIGKQSKMSTTKISPTVYKTTPHSSEKKIVPQMKIQLVPKKISLSPNSPQEEVIKSKNIVSKSKSPKSPINDENDCGNVKLKVPTSQPRTPLQQSNNITPDLPQKRRLFVTPGKTLASPSLGRKKPATYFSDSVSKKSTPLRSDYNSIKSPLNLYIHGTDTDLIQNIKGRSEDFLLTPVRDAEGKSPKLKFKLSAKENKSPLPSCDENDIKTIRYQSADAVHLIDDKASFSPRMLTPNSKTRKLLRTVENTVIIRHEGRVIEYNPDSSHLGCETSIRVQTMAQKATAVHK